MWVFGTPELPIAAMALEVENLGAGMCTEYPSTVFTAFKHLSIKTHAGTPSVSWSVGSNTTDCNQHVTVVSNSNPGGEVDLYYRNPPITVGISGTAEIDAKGTYTWTAVPGGGSGSYTYQWAYREDGGSTTTSGTSSTQAKTIDSGDPNLWWILTVTSGGLSAKDSMYVYNCIGLGSGCGSMFARRRP